MTRTPWVKRGESVGHVSPVGGGDVHTPVHASWLNQIEIYFSIVQRKVLTPNDFASLAEVEDRLLRFQDHYQQAAAPFRWTFTRQDLAALLAKLAAEHRLASAA